jgi:hypothetical protein
MLPKAVVCLPGRAYRLLMAGKNLDNDQINTVSCGRGKPMLEAGKKKTPQIMRLLTKTQRRKHSEKQGFWRNCDLV